VRATRAFRLLAENSSDMLVRFAGRQRLAALRLARRRRIYGYEDEEFDRCQSEISFIPISRLFRDYPRKSSIIAIRLW